MYCALVQIFFAAIINIITGKCYTKSSEYECDFVGSSVSESSSAEKSIAGLLSNALADKQLRRAREYNNRMAQKMYTHTRHNLHTLTD